MNFPQKIQIALKGAAEPSGDVYEFSDILFRHATCQKPVPPT